MNVDHQLLDGNWIEAALPMRHDAAPAVRDRRHDVRPLATE
jgi:hypothetical protein